MSRNQSQLDHRWRGVERRRRATGVGGRIAAGAGVSLAAILAVPAVAEAATFTVTKTQDTSDNGGVGACATSGACSLREAINAANADATADTIVFASTVSGTIALDHGGGSSLPQVTEPVTIDGAGTTDYSGGYLRVFGLGFHRPFDIDGADSVTIRKLQLHGGLASGGGAASYGGAIRTVDTDVTLEDLTLFENDAQSAGGGVGALGGTLTIEGSTISGNDSGYRGGGVSAYNATTTIRDSTVIDNDASSWGGGVGALGGTLTIERSTVSGNVASLFGGGVSGEGSAEVTIRRSTLTDNRAYQDGGVLGATTIESSTISGNRSNIGTGGATVLAGGTVRDSTITGNVVSNGVGGVGAGNANLANTIVAGNLVALGGPYYGPSDLAGSFNTAFSLIGTGDGATIVPGGGPNIVGTDANPANPQLGELQANGGPTETHRPAATSPVVDKGLSVLATDQRGLLRPRDLLHVPNAAGGNGADIGAVELTAAEGPPPPTTTTSPPASNLAAFRRCVRRANAARKRAVRRANRTLSGKARARAKRRAAKRRARAVRRCRARFL